jgi:hypothetical protein
MLLLLLLSLLLQATTMGDNAPAPVQAAVAAAVQHSSLVVAADGKTAKLVGVNNCDLKLLC